MSFGTIFLVLIVLVIFGHLLGRQRAKQVATAKSKGRTDLASLPNYYGYMVAIWTGLPALLLVALWTAFNTTVLESITLSGLPDSYQQATESELGLLANEIKNLSELSADEIRNSDADTAIAAAAVRYKELTQVSYYAKGVVVLAVAMISLLLAWRYIRPHVHSRNFVERVIRVSMIVCASIAILTTVGIVFSVLFESLRFFGKVPVTEFLFGTQWSPQTALRADQVGGSGTFGAIPLFVGTLLISIIALTISVPLGLMSAIYLSEYANRRVRAFAKPTLEILAGIPTVVYGFFAAITVAPFVRNLGMSLGLDVSAESALAAGIVMGVMIIPFVSSLSDDVISAVPQALRDGAYGMGATRSETILQVVIPAALPGVVGGILLAASRAIGETMIVVMAAGLGANLTFNPLEAVTTVTVQIVSALKGDQEFDSAKTLSAFALGLSLFVITLILNYIALRIIRRYREQYD